MSIYTCIYQVPMRRDLRSYEDRATEVSDKEVAGEWSEADEPRCVLRVRDVEVKRAYIRIEEAGNGDCIQASGGKWKADCGVFGEAMRVYISGAISGREPNKVRKEFELAKMYLRREGYEAISPLANGLPWDCAWEVHMREDLHLLLECDKVAMLPGWRESKGARLEVFVASELGMEVMPLMGKEFLTNYEQ